jgi:hypothetical protein
VTSVRPIPMQHHNLSKCSPLARTTTALVYALRALSLKRFESEVLLDSPVDSEIGDGRAVYSLPINNATEAAADVRGGTLEFPVGTFIYFNVRLEAMLDRNLASEARPLLRT